MHKTVVRRQYSCRLGKIGRGSIWAFKGSNLVSIIGLIGIIVLQQFRIALPHCWGTQKRHIKRDRLKRMVKIGATEAKIS